MQTRKLLTLLCLVWQCLLFGVVSVGAAAKPLSVEDIEYLLKEGVTARRVAGLVEEQGVSFDTVTAEIRRRLTKAGADPGVIQAVERMALARKKTVKPPVSQERPSQIEPPPRIDQRIPDEATMEIPSGESRKFSAMASDPNDKELAYVWMVDSKQAGQGDQFTFTAKEAGLHRIELEVTNRKGFKAKTTWNVQVQALSATLREVMFTPHQDHCSLFLHQSRFFAMQVEVLGVAEPSLDYKWTVNGQSVPGREVFEFKDQPMGLYEVVVVVTPSSGVPLQRRWAVEVHGTEESDNIGPIWSPRIEIFDQKDIVASADQPMLMVTGKVRNLDDDRSADNVVVWVSTRDQGEKVLARRIAVPTPQPLTPGQVGSFQVLLPNQTSVAGFHYEVLYRNKEDEDHKKVEAKLIRRAEAAQRAKQWTEAEALLRTAMKVYPPDQERLEKLLQEVTATRQGTVRATGTEGGVIEAK